MERARTFAERMSIALQRTGGRADNPYDAAAARHHVETEVAREISEAVVAVCRERNRDPHVYSEKMEALRILATTRPDLMALQRELHHQPGASEERR